MTAGPAAVCHDVVHLEPDGSPLGCVLRCACGTAIAAVDPLAAHRAHQAHIASTAVRSWTR
jgi:hypothetical protein